MKIIDNPPNFNIFTSYQSVGSYDLPMALADLIDNSITAEAKNIVIDQNFFSGSKNDSPQISILDDGTGMSEPELKDAMITSLNNPNEIRRANDLGRFGLGLKTASFSQCDRLVVISKKNNKISGAAWDLKKKYDTDAKFPMELLDFEYLKKDLKIKDNLETLYSQKSGTLVIWKNCRRLTDDYSFNQNMWDAEITEAETKLGMIFYRFLNQNYKLMSPFRHINILSAGRKIEAIDPFFTKLASGYKQEPISLPLVVDGVNEEIITVTPYFLPHKNMMDDNNKLIEQMDGREGMTRNQGFYVFRNERLIIYGTWFKLTKFTDSKNLIRISIDIPNNMDDIWNISLDKSNAQLPRSLRISLKEIINRLRNKVDPINKRKVHKNKKDIISVWEEAIGSDEINYVINKNYNWDEYERDEILAIVENYLPIDQIRNRILNNRIVTTPDFEIDYLSRLAKKIYDIKFEKIQNKEKTFKEIFSFDKFKRFEKKIRDFIEEE